MQLFKLASLLSFIAVVKSLYAEEAGVFDWHQEHVGVIKSPLGVSFAQRNTILGSEAGIIAQVNSKNGNFGWRVELQQEQEIIAIKVVGARVYALTQQKEALTLPEDANIVFNSLYAFNLESGSGVWAREKLPCSSNSQSISIDEVLEGEDPPSIIDMQVKESSIFLLFPNCLARIDAANGKVIFHHEIMGQGKAILVHDETISCLSIREGFGLHIDIYDLKGESRRQHEYPSIQPVDAITIHHSLHHAYAVMNSRLSGPTIIKLSDIMKGEPLKLPPALSESKIIPTFTERNFGPQFVVKSQEHGFQVVQINEGDHDSFSIAYSFPKNNDPSFFFYNHITEGAASISKVQRHLDVIKHEVIYFEDGEVRESKFQTNFNFDVTGDIEWIAVDFFNRRGSGFLPRLVFGTSDESMHCIRDQEKSWSLEESLTATSFSLFIEHPSSGSGSLDVDELGQKVATHQNESVVERFVVRAKKHAHDLKSILTVDYLLERFHKSSTVEQYGFNKLAIFVSRKGKMVAIETEFGRQVWQKMLPFAPKGIFLTRDYRVASPPVICIVGHTNVETTLAYEFNALNGGILSKMEFPILSHHIFVTGVENPMTSINSVAIVHENLEISLFPSNADILNAFSLSKVYFYTTPGVGSNYLQGYVTGQSTKHGKLFTAFPTWRISLPGIEKIASLSQSTQSQVASLGRVLGDRSVLYKYLNPNLMALISNEQSSTFATTYLYLIDTVSGTIHSKKAHYGAGHVSLSHPSIYSFICENFVVYSFWNHGPKYVEPSFKAPTNSLSNSMHFEIVVMELYESLTPDVRFNSLNFSSFSNHRLESISESFVLSHPVAALGVTQTEAGITSKEILVGYAHGAIQGVPRRILDPRRPANRQPTNEEKEEGLIPYHPFLAINPKDVATYNKNVIGMKSIRALPTNLESTSIIMASGIDIFVTRRMPSRPFDTLSKDFSYLQLIASIVILLVGTYFSQLKLDEKRIKEAWE